MSISRSVVQACQPTGCAAGGSPRACRGPAAGRREHDQQRVGERRRRPSPPVRRAAHRAARRPATSDRRTNAAMMASPGSAATSGSAPSTHGRRRRTRAPRACDRGGRSRSASRRRPRPMLIGRRARRPSAGRSGTTPVTPEPATMSAPLADPGARQQRAARADAGARADPDRADVQQSPSSQQPARSTSGSTAQPLPSFSSPVTGGRVCRSTSRADLRAERAARSGHQRGAGESSWRRCRRRAARRTTAAGARCRRADRCPAARRAAAAARRRPRAAIRPAG